MAVDALWPTLDDIASSRTLAFQSKKNWLKLMLWLGETILFFLTAVLVHSAFSRMQISRNTVLIFCVAGSTIGFGLILWLCFKYGIATPEMWAGLLSYAFFCELYIFLFTLVVASISANLLTNLYFQEITDADMERLYDSRHMVAARLDRLVVAGLLNESSGRLKLTTKGVRSVQFFNRMKAFFRHLPLRVGKSQ